MPTGRAGHCSITLHDGKIMLIGGHPIRNGVLVFDPEDNSFKPGPSLLYWREFHGCALFFSAKHGGRPVVLSAGDYYEYWTAEILDYSVPNARWERSKLFFS